MRFEVVQSFCLLVCKVTHFHQCTCVLHVYEWKYTLCRSLMCVVFDWSTDCMYLLAISLLCSSVFDFQVLWTSNLDQGMMACSRTMTMGVQALPSPMSESWTVLFHIHSTSLPPSLWHCAGWLPCCYHSWTPRGSALFGSHLRVYVCVFSVTVNQIYYS